MSTSENNDIASKPGPAEDSPRLADNPNKAEQASSIFKALCHPLRLRIVAILSEGPQHVSGLTERLGVTQALVSQQLGVLRLNGLVEAHREAGFAYYNITFAKLADVVQCVEKCGKL